MTVPDDRGRGILFGDVCVDLVLSVPEETGKARRQASPEVHGGGTVANTAVALARLGAKTHFVGVVGDDLFGREALEELVTEGIDVSCVELSGRRPTMIVIALIDGTGQRTVLGWPRRDQAFVELHERQLDRLDLTARDWLHTSGVCMVQEHGRRATLRALDRARARKVRSSFDLNLRLAWKATAFRSATLKRCGRRLGVRTLSWVPRTRSCFTWSRTSRTCGGRRPTWPGRGSAWPSCGKGRLEPMYRNSVPRP